MKKKRIAVSGGFDPVHVGHVRMIQAAAKFGDVIVICNSDAWLKRKKGYSFMPFEERAEILRAFKGVKDVSQSRSTHVNIIFLTSLSLRCVRIKAITTICKDIRL